ncbi:N-benzyl-3-pyrrolidinol dehydrogenase [Epithele typhae]|uniref:N-benzyl-3-pyrrolidinol dehydrogenase n=1 Tax=Epithele typhae TaxID=378194 RepID=UPI002007B5E5|nr:N-benzyl-3-pyrrolidinol dehydrogenase [Epithele typhae]KAH9943281.1 N-benzyl-3-pyrrolidinol dehydrogenase [Epithele typhae]
MSTMRAAVFHPGNNNLVLEHIPIPKPGPNQVLLKVAAAGVCHSDTAILTDVLDDSRTYVLGHENVGYAVEWGHSIPLVNVRHIAKGKLYAIHDLVPHGAHPLAPGQSPLTDSIGIGENGGFAEYILADSVELVPVPEGLAPEVAALATDSLITAYNAVHNVAGDERQLRPGSHGKRVLIYGIGGLGHQAVNSLSTTAPQSSPSILNLCARARDFPRGYEGFPPGELAQLFATENAGPDRFAVDIVIDFVATAQSFQIGQEAVKLSGFSLDGPHGLIVLVGVSGENLTFNQIALLTFRTNVLSSLYGSKDDLKACLELLSDQLTMHGRSGCGVPVVAVEPLENVNQVLDELRSMRVTGRKVINPMLAPFSDAARNTFGSTTVPASVSSTAASDSSSSNELVAKSRL